MASYTILGPPRTKKNSMQMVGTGTRDRPRLLQSKAAMEWADSAVLQLRSQRRGALPWQEPTNLMALVYQDAARQADLGNYLAAICDALQKAGVVFNDKYIRGFDGSRIYIDRRNPRVEIHLSPL
jgi:Holliday junction resolvase RusA-like endonuclease